MFNGFRVLNKNYIYLFLDNKYEFASDINTRRKKENTIISECKNYLIGHNLSFNDKLYFVSNGVVIGYITKDKFKNTSFNIFISLFSNSTSLTLLII